MKEEIKALWLDALRDGHYQQGKGRLRDNKNRFCCLGVLCDLAATAGVGFWQTASNEPEFSSAGNPTDWSGGALPGAVVEWAGLQSSDPVVTCNESHGDGPIELSQVNDNGWTFVEIADTIERSL